MAWSAMVLRHGSLARWWRPAYTRRAYVAYQVVMLGLALLTIWLITVPDDDWVERANLAIWAIFATDYLVRLAAAPRRLRFVRGNVPDLIASLPLDLLAGGDQFGIGRLFRLARFFRLLRGGVLLWRVGRSARGILGTNSLGHVLLFMLGSVLAGGFAIWVVEPDIETLGDGVWWALVTATTVGYGDISPKTASGRAIAAILMVLGITTFGMVTAALTTFFLGRQKEIDPHVSAVIAQLERWNELSDPERRRIVAMLEALSGVDTRAGR